MINSIQCHSISIQNLILCTLDAPLPRKSLNQHDHFILIFVTLMPYTRTLHSQEPSLLNSTAPLTKITHMALRCLSCLKLCNHTKWLRSSALHTSIYTVVLPLSAWILLCPSVADSCSPLVCCSQNCTFIS